jgi:hypothetical protein
MGSPLGQTGRIPGRRRKKITIAAFARKNEPSQEHAMPELPSITSKAFLALAKALLKFSITILFTAPSVFSSEWLIRLLTALAVQCARHIAILLPLTNCSPSLLQLLWAILTATIRFLAR